MTSTTNYFQSLTCLTDIRSLAVPDALTCLEKERRVSTVSNDLVDVLADPVSRRRVASVVRDAFEIFVDGNTVRFTTPLLAHRAAA